MKSIIPSLNENLPIPLYLQLYEYIKNEIIAGNILPNEKLPSLRGLSKVLNLSITTVESAYNQLVVEGYISSRPQSGYYVNSISIAHAHYSDSESNENEDLIFSSKETADHKYYDLSCFDFVKWKKCINKIVNEYPHLLLEESSPQGEEALRLQISRYVYQSRGVKCVPDQIIIGAGTQQIMGLLCLVLNMMGMRYIGFEDPGYLPVRKVFLDRGFDISYISIEKNGINLSDLRNSLCTAVYVSPSNQFPMGYVMPIAKRYELLEWAYENNGIIIEDDYDSELRYFGKPVSALQGLDKKEKVVYLGSFSSTLFPSIKISYMILPKPMMNICKTVISSYNQTCSKTEQLTLALYMKKGMYQTNIKKIRKQYSQKAYLTTDCINKTMAGFVKILNNTSGIHMLIEVKSKKSAEELCCEALRLGIETVPITKYTMKNYENSGNCVLIMYYTRIPLKDIPKAIEELSKIWKN